MNIGSPTVQPGSSEVTGIFKTPRSGPVMIDAEGVLGDTIIDRVHHGGPDQAAYVYLSSDYDFWAEELGTALEPGTFGENVTIAGVDGTGLAVGDRFAMGEVVIEVTDHRTPCATFARRMGDPKWVRRFQRAGRPGAYARVIVPGIVETGMEVTYTPFAGERVTVSEMMSFNGVASPPTDFIRRVLKTPVHHKARAKYEAALLAS